MIDELLVSATPFGVRTVTIASGKVVAFNAESTRAPELLGNIYMAAEGRRAGAAHFVAIAKEQNAFLDKIGGANPGGNLLVQVTRAKWRGKAPRVTAEIMGHTVKPVYDAGVAGLHRLLSETRKIREADCIIAVAGMEGALAGVVGGLSDVPVIAVPTSGGYGANLGGITPLLTMLSSCAAGVAVVNIDNGFGAGFMAALISRKHQRD